MTVKTRLVVSTAVVLAVALAGLVAVVTTLTSNQARADGLEYARSLATSGSWARSWPVRRPPPRTWPRPSR